MVSLRSKTSLGHYAGLLMVTRISPRSKYVLITTGIVRSTERHLFRLSYIFISIIPFSFRYHFTCKLIAIWFSYFVNFSSFFSIFVRFPQFSRFLFDFLNFLDFCSIFTIFLFSFSFDFRDFLGFLQIFSTKNSILRWFFQFFFRSVNCLYFNLISVISKIFCEKLNLQFSPILFKSL